MGYNEHFSRAVCFREVSTKMLVGYLGRADCPAEKGEESGDPAGLCESLAGNGGTVEGKLAEAV